MDFFWYGRYNEEGGRHDVTEIEGSGTCPHCTKPQPVERKDVSQTPQLQPENEQKESEDAKSQLLKMRHEMGALLPLVCQLKKKLVDAQTQLQESCTTNANLGSELECEQKTFRIMEAQFQREKEELQRAVADARSLSRPDAPTPPRPTPESKHGDKGEEVHQILLAAQAKIATLEMALQEQDCVDVLLPRSFHYMVSALGVCVGVRGGVGVGVRGCFCCYRLLGCWVVWLLDCWIVGLLDWCWCWC